MAAKRDRNMISFRRRRWSRPWENFRNANATPETSPLECVTITFAFECNFILESGSRIKKGMIHGVPQKQLQ